MVMCCVVIGTLKYLAVLDYREVFEMDIEETGLKIFLTADVVAFAAMIGDFAFVMVVATLFVGVGLFMFIVGRWT